MNSDANDDKTGISDESDEDGGDDDDADEAEAIETGDDDGANNTPMREHPIAHIAMKRLLQADVRGAPDASATLFANALHERVRGTLIDWAQSNRGAFIALRLVEGGDAEIKREIMEELTRDRPALAARAAHADAKGAQALLRHVDGKSMAK